MSNSTQNSELTLAEQFEALKLQMLQPLTKERNVVLKKLNKLEKQIAGIDPNYLTGGMPTRLDYATHKVLEDSEEGLTFEDLQVALKGHKSIAKLTLDYLNDDEEIELSDGKFVLKVA
jgi:hypothetical protein